MKTHNGCITELKENQVFCFGSNKSGFHGAIDFHHLDSSKKDKNFRNLANWSWDRIKKEIENCVPSCKVCHAEVHAGIRKIKIGEKIPVDI